ncbi:MAG: hypothetical protein OEO79_04215 [Gemmatimonadota bacterium]|nr:hypothetical protein [Gemmatimonadota bacterium]MDH3422332.1 hypothetical protein [Gemmatimonadota bacterium]
MSTIIDAIGPLAFWVIALGIVPGLVLVLLMVLISRVVDRKPKTSARAS